MEEEPAMSARDVIAKGCATMKDQNGAWAIGRGTRRRADAILAALHAMPHHDRLALARELAGPEWAVVPREPTLRMVGAARDEADCIGDIYRAMLSASENEPGQ